MTQKIEQIICYLDIGINRTSPNPTKPRITLSQTNELIAIFKHKALALNQMDQTNPNVSTNIIPKKYKVVILGDQSVGKTSIIKRYSEKGFNPDIDVNPKKRKFERISIPCTHWDLRGSPAPRC